MRIVFVTFLFLNFYFLLTGQTGFREGYIITLNQDTAYGTIDFRGDINNSLKCIFKNKSDVSNEYSPKI